MSEQYYIEQTQRKKKWAFIILLILFFYLLNYTSGFKIAKIGRRTSAQALSSQSNTVKITQANKDFCLIKDLDIFCNPEFGGNKIIAPESMGKYTFQVENTFKNEVLCNIQFDEINEHNINMKYKLKKDNVYIVGNENTWIDTDKLFADTVNKANSKSKYVLEWYWESAENDTEIGKLANVEYKLNINIQCY